MLNLGEDGADASAMGSVAQQRLVHSGPPALAGALGALSEQPADRYRLVREVLRAVRQHMGLEVAFVSEFKDGRRIFRAVDSSLAEPPVRVGGSDPLDDSYCQRVVDGRLPELILDATHLPAAADIPATRELPVGAHVSVPIWVHGRVHGTFCCFSTSPRVTLNSRDVETLRAFAEVVACELERDGELWAAVDVLEADVDDVVAQRTLEVALQPIVRLPDRAVVGMEALARFPWSARPTQDWFRDAAACGRANDLERLAVEVALARLDHVPAGAYLSVNLSAPVLLAEDPAWMLEVAPAERLVVELSEHSRIDDYRAVATRLRPLRDAGVRLCVDDAGAGYSSLTHVLELQPDVVKLDLGMTRGIGGDPARQAMAAALVEFGRRTASAVVAEGIETARDLAVVEELGVELAQGYFLGRPVIVR